MARLLIKTEGLGIQALELHLGVNHVGRDPDCEQHLNNHTVSALHCELSLTSDGVYLRDCHSTNGWQPVIAMPAKIPISTVMYFDMVIDSSTRFCMMSTESRISGRWQCGRMA